MKQQRKKEKNIFTETDNRNGMVHTVVSKTWPDGERFRRRCPNLATARNLLARINVAVSAGTWKEVRNELTEKPKPPEREITVRDFGDVYLDYCKVVNTRPDFKEETLEVIKEIVGDIPIKEFKRSDAMDFVEFRSKQGVSNATVNRGIAVLSNMLSFALNKGIVEAHPMSRFKKLPEPQKALRVMTLKEERKLVDAVMSRDPVIGAYVGILGETGLRMMEGLRLKWEHVSFPRRNLTVEASKNYKTREVPLSDYAIELLNSLPRIQGVPFVFINEETQGPVKAPRRPLYQGRKTVNLPWVGFHDFRHFRATQWVMGGLDLRTVQELLGHRDIQTTMRYAHFAPDHAAKRVIEIQRQEAAQIWQQTGNGEVARDESVS